MHGNHDHSSHAPKRGEAEQTHICPMHPEIRQAGPGRCPLCGMALVPVKAGQVARPIAAGALASKGIILQPAVAAVFMSLSTVIVAVNALLLRSRKL